MTDKICRIRKLTVQLNQWRHEYFNLNSPTVEDAVYDHHFDELKKLEEMTGLRMANSPTQTVGYENVDGLPKTNHPYPLLSLDKTKNITDTMSFIGPHQVLLMHKLDGLTLKVEYEDGLLVRASTRGNGEEGEVVTHNARAIEGLPDRIPYKQRLVVVGEAYITKPTFQRLKATLLDSTGKPYSNARNMAAGSVRCHDASSCAERGLVFSAFGVIEGLNDGQAAVSKFHKLMSLGGLGFSTCKFIMPDTGAPEKTISATISNLEKMADDDGLPIDGVVVTYNDIPYSLSRGRTGHYYRDGIAFKFTDELFETIFRSIEWQPSRFEELSPVAVFDSVEIDGCDVSRASLGVGLPRPHDENQAA